MELETGYSSRILYPEAHTGELGLILGSIFTLNPHNQAVTKPSVFLPKCYLNSSLLPSYCHCPFYFLLHHHKGILISLQASRLFSVILTNTLNFLSYRCKIIAKGKRKMSVTEFLRFNRYYGRHILPI